jgi:DNA-binding helix-hairpin-helix protein with protein kinase domain
VKFVYFNWIFGLFYVVLVWIFAAEVHIVTQCYKRYNYIQIYRREEKQKQKKYINTKNQQIPDFKSEKNDT